MCVSRIASQYVVWQHGGPVTVTQYEADPRYICTPLTYTIYDDDGLPITVQDWEHCTVSLRDEPEPAQLSTSDVIPF